MTRRSLILMAMAGSAAMLLGAFAFQHLGGLAPCKMCLWQRWPHAAAVVLGAMALVVPASLLLWGGALAALATAGIGVFHTGVERGWWEGPSTCTSGDISTLSTDDLLDQIMSAPLVRCDEVAWEFLSLSMASWNAVISLAFCALWIVAARLPR
ncbi:MAG: disulfide bond formation protein B [Paracoccaceae bacterium]